MGRLCVWRLLLELCLLGVLLWVGKGLGVAVILERYLHVLGVGCVGIDAHVVNLAILDYNLFVSLLSLEEIDRVSLYTATLDVSFYGSFFLGFGLSLLVRLG